MISRIVSINEPKPSGPRGISGARQGSARSAGGGSGGVGAPGVAQPVKNGTRHSDISKSRTTLANRRTHRLGEGRPRGSELGFGMAFPFLEGG